MQEKKSTKREILKSLSSNAYLIDGKIELELRKPFDVLLIPELDENKKKAQKSLSAPEFFNWLGRWDSNPRHFG
jgi:hypothetical protein